ncbi:MAG: ABC transporter substrate-binding protein [Treponema sp.]|nr:ABC transporter substrate-binding protein [Treponema sp.]
MFSDKEAKLQFIQNVEVYNLGYTIGIAEKLGIDFDDYTNYIYEYISEYLAQLIENNLYTNNIHFEDYWNDNYETHDIQFRDVENSILKIGVYEPASGDNGTDGKQETLGVQYANTVTPTVEIAGKTYKVQLEIVDNESSNDKAVTAASELINKGVSIVLGSYGSGVSIAASDSFKDANVPVVGITCTNPQGTVLANFAVDNFKSKRAYCLAKLGDDYSVALCNYFIKAFKKLGGEVVFETFPDGTSDFSAYIANAKSNHADVFFSPVSLEAAALIIEQANTQGMTMPILAGDTWDSNVVLAAAKGTNVKIFVTTFFVEGSKDKIVTDFVDGFRNYINTNATAKTNNGGDDEIAAVSAMGFDAYYTALAALKLAGSTKPDDVMAALPKTTLTGISGAIAFDSTGDVKRDGAYVKQVNTVNGKWKYISFQKTKSEKLK